MNSAQRPEAVAMCTCFMNKEGPREDTGRDVRLVAFGSWGVGEKAREQDREVLRWGWDGEQRRGLSTPAGTWKPLRSFAQGLTVVFTELWAVPKACGEARSPEVCPPAPQSALALRGLLGPGGLSPYRVGWLRWTWPHWTSVFLSVSQSWPESWKGRTGKGLSLCPPYPPVPNSITDSTFHISLKCYVLCLLLRSRK